MTPKEAQYYLLMLRLGEYDEYDQALDRLLEEQDPLSPLVLELAFCMSDRQKTISVLHNFLLDHPVEERTVMESQLEWVRKQYRKQAMTAVQAGNYLYRLIVANDWEDPWCDLYQYVDLQDLYEDGHLSRDIFETCFEAALLRGEMLNPWELEKQQKKDPSLLGRLRSLIGK